jgi:hypothetical protein
MPSMPLLEGHRFPPLRIALFQDFSRGFGFPDRLIGCSAIRGGQLGGVQRRWARIVCGGDDGTVRQRDASTRKFLEVCGKLGRHPLLLQPEPFSTDKGSS